jgi:hypothetical protein
MFYFFLIFCFLESLSCVYLIYLDIFIFYLSSRVAAEEVRIDKCTVVPGGTFTKSYTTYDIKVVRPDSLGGTTVVARRFSEVDNIPILKK